MKHYSLPRQLLHLALMWSLLGASAWLALGCRHNISSNPKVVFTATLLDASNTEVTVEDGLLAASHVLEQLEQTEPDYYAKVKPLLQKISAANRVAAEKTRAAAHGDATADWRGAIIAVGQSVKPADLTAFGFKNPNSQLLVQAGFATLVAVLESLPAKFGSSSGVSYPCYELYDMPMDKNAVACGSGPERKGA